MRMTTPKEVRMRGDDQEQQGAMWSYVPMERRIPADHPLRRMRPMVDGLLQELSPRFDELYSRVGRPSIAPEKLLRALLLQVLYTIRSERLLMEQLDYNLLFRWFVGLEMDDPIWNPTVFTKNRERLLAGEIARAFFDRVVAQARERGLLSDEHFTVDGTLVEAWASLKSFKRKDAPAPPPDDPGNPTVNFHGERRSNATHASTTDPDARLFRKGDAHEAKLYYTGHVLMENRHGLAVDGCVTPASGHAERAAALELVGTQDREGGVTLGADKSYDTRDFVQAVRLLGVTPHVAQNTSKRASAIDGRTTRHRGYRVSQRRRKRVEEIFGWLKTVGLMRKTRHRGTRRVDWMLVTNVCGFLSAFTTVADTVGSAESAAMKRSLRKYVARSARSPARRIAVVVGFGTVLSPLANWMMIGFASIPSSGLMRKCGAYATGLPDCETHSTPSSTSWMRTAPGTVLVTGGWFRSGMFSLNCGKKNGGVAIGIRGRLSRAGTRKANENATRARKDGLRRAISMIAPPGTLATPARTLGSTARNIVP